MWLNRETCEWQLLSRTRGREGRGGVTLRMGSGEIDGEAIAIAARKALSDHSHCKTKPECCGCGGEGMYIYLLRVCVCVCDYLCFTCVCRADICWRLSCFEL